MEEFIAVKSGPDAAETETRPDNKDYDDASDVFQLVRLLKKRKYHITTVESCTGGAICSKIVDVPGASDVLEMAFVTYCDKAKHRLVGVKKKTLKKHTAVSRQAARQMAEGGMKKAGADICLSATGVAGPGGTDDFPAGLVFLGCCMKGKSTVKKFVFSGDRNKVREKAVNEAVRMAIEALGQS